MKRIIFGMLMIALAFNTMAQENNKGKSKGNNKANSQGNNKGKSNNNKGKGPKTADERAKNSTEKLTKELTLSESQQTSVYNLAKERSKSIDEIKAKYPEDKKSAQKEIKAVKEKFRADVRTLLTAEQAAKWDESRRKADMKNKEDKQPKDKQNKPEAVDKKEKTKDDSSTEDLESDD